MKAFRKALLPLKKGGREGFLGMPFQKAKLIQLFEFDWSLSCGSSSVDHKSKKEKGEKRCVFS